MGFGSLASYKRWAFPIQPSAPKQPLRHPTALTGREALFESGRSTHHLVLEGGEVYRDAPKAYTYSSGATQSTRSSKIHDVELYRGSYNSSSPINTMEDSPACVESLRRSSSHIQFSLLMENLGEIEDILAGGDAVRLERDIMLHIGKLGALKLFRACLSRTLMAPTSINSDFLLTENFRGYSSSFPLSRQEAPTIVRSGRSEERRLRRMRASSKRSEKVKDPKVSAFTRWGGLEGPSESRSRPFIARKEAQMAKGVKEIADLDNVRLKLEGEIGHSASYARWAKAAGIDQKTLQRRLQFGWYCRDKLIKSTNSLVMYLARNYRGKGIAFDDLLQVTVERSIKRIQTARRTFYDGEGRYPEDDEMAELTGLSLANVRVARRCSRVAASLDKEIVDGWRLKFMEVTPDASIKSPDAIIGRQHMNNDIMELLESLETRERQVILLRYGLIDGRCKSFGEIAKLSCVTKEWIRKIERTALSKICKDDIRRELKCYLNYRD
ncbi:RNA polymerase sigma factor sigC isoform X2 [Asparagus officinalis]|uniref:RNA polymerase sigma factor sigC isoform X2 n=1 Tax=Asparagus officinalis TaxID=4686 RepID=UPI00098E0468|nr:RNA polymerase sigma factor sigC isoform X2 [Asparagus officinalis]